MKEVFRPDPEDLGESRVETSESILERGKRTVGATIGNLRGEGEQCLANVFATMDKITGRKHHPEWLRKMLGEPSQTYTGDLKSYRANRDEQVPTLGPAFEATYGALSLGARKAIEQLCRLGSRFGGDLGRLLTEAAGKFSSAESLYGTKEE